jgi:hypothetical protein
MRSEIRQPSIMAFVIPSQKHTRNVPGLWLCREEEGGG